MAKTGQKQYIGDVFLRNYVGNLIVNSAKEEDNPRPEVPQPAPPFNIPYQGGLTVLPAVPSVPRSPNALQKHTSQFLKIPLQHRPQKRIPKPQSQGNIVKETIPKEMPPLPQSKPHLEDPLAQIMRVIHDPAVVGVECPGPEKNILVNRSGSIQVTPIIFTKEDIDTIMNAISNITRVPVIPGVFKAAFQNYLITAVVSEFVGTRFIIQKRVPQRFAPSPRR